MDLILVGGITFALIALTTANVALWWYRDREMTKQLTNARDLTAWWAKETFRLESQLDEIINGGRHGDAR